MNIFFNNYILNYLIYIIVIFLYLIILIFLIYIYIILIIFELFIYINHIIFLEIKSHLFFKELIKIKIIFIR